MPRPTCAIFTASKEELDVRLEREGRTALAQACFDFLPHRALLDLAGWPEDRHFRACLIGTIQPCLIVPTSPHASASSGRRPAASHDRAGQDAARRACRSVIGVLGWSCWRWRRLPKRREVSFVLAKDKVAMARGTDALSGGHVSRRRQQGPAVQLCAPDRRCRSHSRRPDRHAQRSDRRSIKLQTARRASSAESRPLRYGARERFRSTARSTFDPADGYRI